MDERVCINHPFADQLADLGAISNDLRTVIQLCELFLRTPNAGSDDALIGSNAIASFAVIMLFRTKPSGLRHGLRSDQIDALPIPLKSTYDRLAGLRDKHIAHALSRIEVDAVEVVLSSDMRSLESLGTIHARPATFASNDVEALKDLATHLLAEVDRDYDLAFDRVWDLFESLSDSERASRLVIRKLNAHYDGALRTRHRSTK